MFRDRLLEDFGSCVDTLREDYPTLDLKTVRQLVKRTINEFAAAESAAGDQAISLSPSLWLLKFNSSCWSEHTLH